MSNPIRTTKFMGNHLVQCAYCRTAIVAVEATVAEAADAGRLHLKNAHTSVRWRVIDSDNPDQCGELPGSSYYARLIPSGAGTWNWVILNSTSHVVAGGLSSQETSARTAAEEWLLNDPR